MRKTKISSPEDQKKAASTGINTSTLPPHIRRILDRIETPTPRLRNPRRFDMNGRPLPAGPPPPPSWLCMSILADCMAAQTRHRLYPHDLGHLPDIPKRSGLQDTCLRNMAIHWEVLKEYERNNLYALPTQLRMALLSYIAIYGPEDGIGIDGLKALLISPVGDRTEDSWESKPMHNNGDFFRLDLSGSIGRSVHFKQLIPLVRSETPINESTEETWESSIPTSISAALPRLTHLSLSHPSSSISWTRFLIFAKMVPTLTHLSLAYWPAPSSSPNSTTTVMTSRHTKELQYGGINYYSHSMDDDYSEAASIFKRLAASLYSLEYLDLTGCGQWWRTLRWIEDAETLDDSLSTSDFGVNWASQWPKMGTLVLKDGFECHADSNISVKVRHNKGVEESKRVDLYLRLERKQAGRKFIECLRDVEKFL